MKRNSGELKFPVFDSKPLPPSKLTLEQTIAWVDENYRLFFNREAYEKKKKALSVNVPFTL
jgi:hypothetical protein